MKRIIKPTDIVKNESGRNTTSKSETISVWIENRSTIAVWLGTLVEDDLVIVGTVHCAPNERKLFSIYSEAILAIELDKLPPENEALFFANEDALEPVIQITDATDDIRYPIKIGIASEVFNQITQDDYDIIILQEKKYPFE